MTPTPDYDPYPDAETAVYRYTGTSLRLPNGEAGRRVVTAGETVALPDHVADALADSLEAVDDEDEDENEDEEADSEAEPPFDPGEHSVDDLRDRLDEGDYSDAELDALADAEAAGDDRSTAQDAIDAARE